MAKACAAVAIAACGFVAHAAPASASLAPQFHGVSLQTHLTDEEMTRLDRANVGVARFLVSWQATEPRPGVYDWTSMDAYLKGIGPSGAKPLPFISAIPDWLKTDSSGDPMSTVAARDSWRDFMEAVLKRYGPDGTFAEYEPEAATIRSWQIWNEPNLDDPWGGTSDPESYARMVEIASEVIRDRDPDAEVMLAGLAPARNNIRPWVFMKELLQALDPETFDTAAIHPYAQKQKDVNSQIKRFRNAMDNGGARAIPIALTEFGWSSSRKAVESQAGTPRTQARHVNDAYRTFARKRSWDLTSALWYSLRDNDKAPAGCGFCTTSGLLRAGGRPKPAWRSFKASIRSRERTEFAAP